MMTITIRGPQGAGKTTLANALRDMLVECDVTAVLDNEFQVDDCVEKLMCLATRQNITVRIVTEQE